MKFIKFKEQTVIIAENQPEYLPLPAFQFANDPTGRIACCWKLGWWERLKLFFTGRIWHTVMTFGQPLQPQLLELKKPFNRADILETEIARDAVKAERDFTTGMMKKYGTKAVEKKRHMDALNYHPNDRRRTIRFAPDDFEAAKKLGIIFMHGCRIISETETQATQPKTKQ